jgi:phosphoribosylformimino-5-aminoimidazole carboxamide ribotide isomerase
MIIYPALDLMGGRAVRLEQGRFDKVRDYSAEPIDALRAFADAGAEWAHVVDLDGARIGGPAQHALLAALASSAPLRLQVAGGFRERDQLGRMFDAGVARVVVGSLAVRQPETVRSWIHEFGAERIALSLDVVMVATTPMVRISGWAETTGYSLWELAAILPEARHLLVTDIGRDGMLQGPNFDLYREVSKRVPGAQVQASGGVSSLDDLRQLGTAGAIVGKAFWEGRIALEEALGIARA